MSRAKPYRSKPTRDFMIYYDIALQSRYYLVQENGPTKLTLEASNRKKYKISVGSEISCSCGGGRTEHCVHTIYALIKIFRIGEGDPLIWQLSFTDTELEKILETRERQVLRNRSGYQDWQSQYMNVEDQYRQAMGQIRRDEGFRDRNAQLNINPDIMGDADPRRTSGIRIGGGGIRLGGGAAGPGKNWAEKATEERQIKPARPLEEEEMCCVCCDTLRDSEDLSHCLYGCGRQIHTDCLTRCFKHNVTAGKPLNCPLCRTNWGPLGLEQLKENTKKWRDNKKMAAIDNNKSSSVAQMVHGATKAAAAAKPGQQVGGGGARGFQCSSCKRQLLYEGQYQCMLCPNIACCKLCFGVKYHDQHDFLLRPQPDREWEPAFRKNEVLQQSEQYKKLMEELQTRELGPEDYDMLLSLENKQNTISLPRYLAMGFEKAHKPPQSYFDIPKAYCAFCEAEIVDRQAGLQLKNCDHHVHKMCLQDILTTKNECPLCQQKICDGYDVCLNAPKLKPNKVTVAMAKKKKTSANKNLNQELQRQAELNIAAQFGVNGSNFSGMEESKESVVGRRDIFSLQPAASAIGAGRGRGGARPPPGRPPLQNNSRRPNQIGRNVEEEKQQSAAQSALATGGFMGDFNLAGTQIGGTPVTQSTRETDNPSGAGRIQMGRSFRQRPQSLNTRPGQPEEEKKSAQLELNATGMGRGNRFKPGYNGAQSAASASAIAERSNNINKHRLTRDIQEYNSFGGEDVLDQVQERFENAMRDKKVKDSIMKREKEKNLAKAKQMGKNAPLQKYYREQINNQALQLNATGLQPALQGSELTQTKLATGQTPSNVLQESAMQITLSGQSTKKKAQLIRGVNRNANAGQHRPPAESAVQNIRLGSGNRQTRKQWNSQSRQQISNLRAPQRQTNNNPDVSDFGNFIGDMQPSVRQIRHQAGSVPRRNPQGGAQGQNLANCGLIMNSIPTNDPVFADGITGGGVNNIHANNALEGLGIFGLQVER